MNKATKILAAVLVVAGVLLALFALRLGTSNAPAPAATPSPVTQTLTQRYPAVVAAKALAPGQPIAADGVKLVSFDSQTAGGFANPADVVGRVPLVALAAGVPVTQNALARGLALQLAPGERAVAIPVSETVGVSNRIRPGDYVDVFFTMKTNRPAGPAVSLVDDTQARLLASRVRVLSYGNASLDDVSPPPATPSVASSVQAATATAPAPAQPAINAQAPMPATAAVVAVPVADVNRVVLGTQQGKITLALRNPGDDAKPDPSLFPAPPPVLAGKAGLKADDKAALETPENQAYAGIAATGLAGAPTRAPVGTPHLPGARGSSGATIEVVRGAQQSTAAY
ncbi:Flp pilus assembly protein CpaB [Pandoraea cepalis]|uniref:Flp pilus assembly protein CpaB n=1 Tax=Pandoraea cepalis TaxID=2508294 RepID=A0AAW7MNP2_9BURK|nr:Flp pilus assembly protein CpaB [Pandoraea cepalis]MDN4574449.1 Flp pilus assembly protein CpaB [Pandoraea cepalis]MDN4579952.1 Flp pilus assembly protein CpaB [Pandoraea cepalis]